ncbi:hypothetical protein MIND_00072500 [Mycena indigotica]|uniref:Uncharacterized protein n=1 Tax=Mycena indigotica TaxID=2126181 RepID=A0A8H6WF88_9AGAR|nr:uncharacterized protein MIND_00072500 [Mycena indigotica]KAF7315572.1 hypothetical protein MIND_00072500 [Mycena indigotica]
MLGSRPNEQQGDFGRRNAEDSSSSRESSPVRKPPRSFTPTSDDDIDVAQIVAGARDETPPPQNAPIIRASLAFGQTGAFGTQTPVNTYAPVTSKKQTKRLFLPGQEIALPPKTRKKREPRYPGQAGRFRLDTNFDPTPRQPVPAPPTNLSGPSTSGVVEPYTTKYRMDPMKKVREVLGHPPPTQQSKGKSKAAPQQHTSVGSDLSPEEEDELDPMQQQGADASSSSKRNSKGNLLRLVTLLMDDVRGESRVFLLAEVWVLLRESDNVKEDGYWAHAEDICSKLQASAGRIDGPAKVSVLRGKYRQVILRVNEYNEDNWIRGNVIVEHDRTLQVIVENDSPPPRANHKRRRSRSVSEDSGHRGRRRHQSPTPSLPDSRTMRGIDSVSNEAKEQEEEEAVNKRISQEVSDMLSGESNWEQFYRSLGRSHLPGVLSCYTILQSFVDKFGGRMTPSGVLITPARIAAALNIEDVVDDSADKYMERCEATLRLLAFYGPAGTRSQDAEVAKMVDDESIPGYGHKPEVVLLQRLRRLDQEWREAHPTT